MYTLDKIIREIQEYCKMADAELVVPVTINKRLTSTYGRETHKVSPDGYCIPLQIEFSYKMLNTMTDDFIAGVVRHETAHYITILKTHAHHGHDSEFHYWGTLIGCSKEELKSTTEPKYKKAFDPAIEQKYRYDIYCNNCKKVVDHRHRACNVTRYPRIYKCSICNDNNLSVIDNGKVKHE